MKKVWLLIIISGFLAACEDKGSVKVDLNKVGKKFDSAADKIWDSTKVVGKELKHKIKNKLDSTTK
jgi:hypothetical protein